MRIVDISWYPYRLPFCNGFKTAHGTMTARAGAVVEVVIDGEICGIGEIAPLPAFGGDDLPTALAPLPAIAADLRGMTAASALEYLAEASTLLPASTVCGVETALLDAEGKREGCRMGALLTGNSGNLCSEVPVNAVVGVASLEAAIEQVRAAVAAGFACVKLKMGTGVYDEVERVAAVREAIGPDIHLRLDANESWTFPQAVTILTHCSEFAIQYVEQPLKAHDIEGLRELRRRVSIPIAADEAVVNVQSVHRVLRQGAADILIIKPQLIGGLLTAQRIIEEASRSGVQCVITSTMEAGIGLAASLHLAAAQPTITLECGLATLSLLADDLLVDPLPIRKGFLALPAGPGLGVQLDRAALTTYRYK